VAPEAFAGGIEAAAIAEPIIALLSFTVVAVLFVFVKWGLPYRAQMKKDELSIRLKEIEVQEKADAALDARERDRIKEIQASTEQQRQSNENTKALVAVVTALQARLDESASRSHEMGGKVDRIDDKTTAIAKQVNEVHAIVVRKESVWMQKD
jgi:response regulator RpfG family c-di-GMP phosphodiesterase